MALSNYKIPIINGRNANPSINESNPKHPNGSYVISKYNSLVDDLDARFSHPTTKHDDTVEYYVDLTSGNDSNNGTDTSPFLTLEKALQILATKTLMRPVVNVKGTLTDYTVDLSVLRSNPVSADDYWYNRSKDQAVTIKAWDTGLTVHTTHTAPNTKPLVRGATDVAVAFDGIAFTFADSAECIYLDSVLVDFVACTFTEPTTSTFHDSFIWATNSRVYVNGCTFSGGATSAYVAVAGINNDITVDNNNTLNDFTDYDAVFSEESRINVYGGVGSFTNPSGNNYDGGLSDIRFSHYDKVHSDHVNTNQKNRVTNGEYPVLEQGSIFAQCQNTTGDDREVRHNISFTESLRIPANSVGKIQFPSYCRMAIVDWSIVGNDATVEQRIYQMRETLDFHTDSFYGTDGMGKVKSSGTWSESTPSFTQQWYSGNDLNWTHNPADDDTDVIKFMRTCSNNGSVQGFVFDNCYGFPIYVIVKGTFVFI